MLAWQGVHQQLAEGTADLEVLPQPQGAPTPKPLDWQLLLGMAALPIGERHH